MLRVGNTHTINHYNKKLYNLVFVGETLRLERYHETDEGKSTQPITWLTY